MPKQLAIIGAGPVGLEAALYARTLGYPVRVYDRGDVASAVAAWSFVRLFTPWRMNVSPLAWRELHPKVGRDEPPTGQELREQFLLPLAEHQLLRGSILTHHAIVAVGREEAIGPVAGSDPAFRLLVRDQRTGIERVDRADVLVDCSGTFGHHRWAGTGGIPAPGELAAQFRIRYTLPDVSGKERHRFAGKHTLVVGSGYSAATTLQALAELADADLRTKVTWAIRRPGYALQLVASDPLPARRQLVRAMLDLTESPPHWLQFLGTAFLESVIADASDRTFSVTLRSESAGRGTNLALTVDNVVCLVGYSPDNSLFEHFPNWPGQAPKDSFILGAKSYGTKSNFLLTDGHHQIRDAFRVIEGNRDLDLYQE
jgi:thioredoxin reductase